MLCGDREFIRRARHVRKSLGGGMRQAGVLAAAGLVSLHSMVDRLVDDHAHARMLAEGLAVLPGIRLDPGRVLTNIVHFELEPETGIEREELCRRLLDEHDIGLGTYPPNYLRAVTHCWIGAEQVGAFVDGVRQILEDA